jgi:hypothetical protein
MMKKITSFAMALTAALALSGFMAGDADAQIHTAAERQAFRAQQRSENQAIRSGMRNLRQNTRQTNAANRQAWRAAGRPAPAGFRTAQRARRQQTACTGVVLRKYSRNKRAGFRAGVADYRGQAMTVARAEYARDCR